MQARRAYEARAKILLYAEARNAPSKGSLWKGRNSPIHLRARERSTPSSYHSVSQAKSCDISPRPERCKAAIKSKASRACAAISCKNLSWTWWSNPSRGVSVRAQFRASSSTDERWRSFTMKAFGNNAAAPRGSSTRKIQLRYPIEIEMKLASSWTGQSWSFTSSASRACATISGKNLSCTWASSPSRRRSCVRSSDRQPPWRNDEEKTHGKHGSGPSKYPHEEAKSKPDKEPQDNTSHQIYKKFWAKNLSEILEDPLTKPEWYFMKNH